MNIPVFSSYIKRKDMDIVLNCLVTDSVGPGEYLEKFIKTAKEYIGFEYGAALRSKWTALYVALDMLGLSEGATVAVPALAPAFYLDVLKSRKLVPLFLEHDRDTGTVDLESMHTRGTNPSVLLLYDVLGILPDPMKIKSLGVPVVEDISASFGAVRDGIKAGSLGNISILGLEHDGIMTSGGGALLFSCHKREAQVLKNTMDSISDNLVMTDYNAALGLAQCKGLENTIARRKELHTLFAQAIARTKHTTFVQKGEGDSGFWAFPVSISSSMKDVRVYAKKKEIDTEAAFDTSIIATRDFPEGCCPTARSLYLNSVLFPLHQRIGAADATRIVRVLSTLP